MQKQLMVWFLFHIFSLLFDLCSINLQNCFKIIEQSLKVVAIFGSVKRNSQE